MGRPKTNNDMTAGREAAILECAIETWGKRAQVIVTIEECSELIKALTKWLRLREDFDPRKVTPADVADAFSKIREEAADVSIMLNQISFMFGDFNDEEIAKLERLEERIKEARKCRTER